MAVTRTKKAGVVQSVLVVVLLFAIIHLTLSTRASSSATARYSTQKNKKVKACQPLPTHKSPAQLCHHVATHCALDGHVNYLTAYYCPAPSPPTLVAILAWLLFLFSSVGLVASDFFSPNLSTLASRLHLSESTAGVSLLAFGNGSPDVFSTFAAMKSGSGSLAIGELIGAASFITAVVAAAMMLIQPFRVKPYPFLRDVGFFTVAIALALFVLLDGTLHLTESLALVTLYILYAALVIVGSWLQERRRLRKAAERAGLLGAAETRPSVIEAGFLHPAEDDATPPSTTTPTLIDDSDSNTNTNTPTPVQTSFPPIPTTSAASSSKGPSLKLQIPQTPLQHTNRFLAPPTTGPASIHSVPSNASTPTGSPSALRPSSMYFFHHQGKSPSALVRSEYEPDEEGDEDGEPLGTAEIGYATEMDPFDRLAHFPRGNSTHVHTHTDGTISPLASASGSGSGSGARTHLVAPSYTFPVLPASNAQQTAASTSSPNLALVPPHAQLAITTTTTGTGSGSGPATAPPIPTAPSLPLTNAPPTPVRPGYYLPRHSLLGAIEFRDVVRSLQAESAAVAAAHAQSPHPAVGAAGARTPGEYYADEDNGGGSSEEDGEVYLGRRGSGSVAHRAQHPRRTSSLFNPASMNRSASDRGAALASDGSAEAGLSRATSSVSRKSGGRLLASLGFNFGGGGSGSRSRGTSESDELGAQQQQTPSRGNRARHTRGTSLSLVDPGLAPASAAGRRHRHHHHHTRAQSTSVESGLVAPSALRTGAGAGAGAGRRTSLGGPGEEPLAAAAHTVMTPGGGGAARDRGWELFYSRGLELESDWERLASPAGGGGGGAGSGVGAVGGATATAAAGTHAERSREAMRQHVLAAHYHQHQEQQGSHHRSNSQNVNARRRSVKVRSVAVGNGDGNLSAGAGAGAEHRHRRAHSVQPALLGTNSSTSAGLGVPSLHLPPSPDTSGLLGTENLPGIRGMGRSASASPVVVPARRTEEGSGLGGAVDDDGRSSRGVPSILVDDDRASLNDGEEDVHRTPRQGSKSKSTLLSPDDDEEDGATSPRSRTCSASTTLTADAEEEGRGLRMRTTSGTSYAHMYPNPNPNPNSSPSSSRKARRALAHLHYDTLRPIVHTLFPSLRHLWSKSLVGIAVSILSVPAVLVLKLTLPVVVEEEEEEGGDEGVVVEMEKERGERRRLRHGRGSGSGHARGSGSFASRGSCRAGPVRLEGEEHLIVARQAIASPAPLSAEELTPTSQDPNSHVAAGLKSLQAHPEAIFGSSHSGTHDGVLSTSSSSKGKAYRDDDVNEDDATLESELENNDDDDDGDSSISCESCDEAEAEAANADMLSFLEREERKRRRTASRFLALAQLALGPTFCTWAILSPESASFSDPGCQTVLKVLAVGTALVILCNISLALGMRKTMASRPAIRSTISLIRCLGGFVVSVLFIMTIVDEVVSILQAMGIILGLSDAILGLTIFAMGNSLGDLVANITIARMGHPVMAISACFAGPLLNILLGIGLSGTYILTAHQPEGVERPTLILDFSPTLLVSCIGLLVILVGILIAVPLNGFYLDRKLGMTLIITYGVIMTTNILTEIFVDKD